MDKPDVKKQSSLCVGIDLGTTNSVLATINEKANGDIVSKVVEIPRATDMYNVVSGDAKLTTMKKTTLPSYVYYRQERNYEPLVGDFAKMQYSLRPHLVAKSIKSQMGKNIASDLSQDIPDKTPAEISSRILKHLLKETAKIYRCDITEAVITVPANFDSVMCKATRDAAELAGIKVRNDDGTEIPILLSEPNAVIYDLINQIHNGEISSHILDLSEKKRVLVFDLGGGTLDITMHDIKRREGSEDILKVEEIATNRYTLLGGDDFDEEIAKAMYERYLKYYSGNEEVVSKIKKEKKVIMPQLCVYAENLKLELNERCSQEYSSGWDDDDEFTTGGNMGGIGYAYDDTFNQNEIEKILSIFMAKELEYNDYKNIEGIKNTRNIIYPILDVLKKAADKLNTDDIEVDAVIVNGGMSKFYMISERLKQFFNLDPIVALDPDQSVARGAAVYHYYLNKHNEMKEDMKMLGDDVAGINIEKAGLPQVAIEWGSHILNDSLYLGVKNGLVHMIIPTGAELPYTSDIMKGFKVEPGQNIVSVPIKSRNIDGSYRTIANGKISFKNNYSNGAFVAFKIHMDVNKVITMNAWTSSDKEGERKIEEGYAEILIDNSDKSKLRSKIVAPNGSNLNPKEEINNILQLYQNCKKSSNKVNKSNIAKRIAACVDNIYNAGNKEEFAEVIIDALAKVTYEQAKEKLFVIARKIGQEWSKEQKKILSDMCMTQLAPDISGFGIGGASTSTNIEAIHTLSMCGSEKQLSKLAALHEKTKYLQACLYTHARTKTEVDWLKDEFYEDVEKLERGASNNIQCSSYSIGLALSKDSDIIISGIEEEQIVKKLCLAIKSQVLYSEQLTCCILAIAYICDQRIHKTKISTKTIEEALTLLETLDRYYPENILTKQTRPREVAIKMINGEELSFDEEKFLLTKLEK